MERPMQMSLITSEAFTSNSISSCCSLSDCSPGAIVVLVGCEYYTLIDKEKEGYTTKTLVD